MKKIYLEKQFMKALGCDSYILGEIKAVTEKQITIKKKDGNILTVTPHALLGWEDCKIQNLFNKEELLDVYYSHIGEEVIKIIYSVDVYRNTDGTNSTTMTKSVVTNQGKVYVNDKRYDMFYRNYEDIANNINDIISKDSFKNVVDIELRVCNNGLGKGVVDYLKDCDIPIKTYYLQTFYSSPSLLIEKVKNGSLRIDKHVCDMLKEVGVEYKGKGGRPVLRFGKMKNDYKALFSCLLLTIID